MDAVLIWRLETLETDCEAGCPRSAAVGFARWDETLKGTGTGRKEEIDGDLGWGKGRLAGIGLRRASHVAVMQATNFWNRDDRAERWQLDRRAVGRILVERQVSAGPW
jgi:hypothetical protein